VSPPDEKKQGGGGLFRCDSCGIVFNNRAELNEHNARIHPQEIQSTPDSGRAAPEEVRCPTCGMTLASEDELIEHAAKLHQPELAEEVDKPAMSPG
jgi:uncharacterized C2H2 Zn-finger protein